MQKRIPITTEFVPSTEEGGLMVLYTHKIRPSNNKNATMNFLRFDENEKICSPRSHITNSSKCCKSKHAVLIDFD
jgi:predicted SnoaL-like aldol condensation-catalyzing enzyme